MKEAQPIHPPKIEILKYEKDLIAFFYHKIYLPIVKPLKFPPKLLLNSFNVINEAIRSGKIQYADGIFKGNWSLRLIAAFEKEGLKFDKSINGFRKEIKNLPIPTQIAITQAQAEIERTAKEIINNIDNVSNLFDEDLQNAEFTDNYLGSIKRIDNNFTSTIGVSADLSESNKLFIAKEFNNNAKLVIKDFSEDQIVDLRERVEEAVFNGVRAEELQKIIQSSFDISKNKAKFLAKQEISLLTTKYKQSKYQNAGVTEYKWSISNVRTRPDHRALNGQTFFYGEPPITNTDTGERNNPGEDFGCNCIDIPIVPK